MYFIQVYFKEFGFIHLVDKLMTEKERSFFLQQNQIFRNLFLYFSDPYIKSKKSDSSIPSGI